MIRANKDLVGHNLEACRLRFTVLSFFLLASGLAQADNMIIAYSVPLFSGPPPAYQPGNQSNTGSLWLGLDFDVNAPIRIDSLGYFDGSGNGVEGTGIRVAIRNRANSSLIVGTDFTFTGTTGYLANNDRFFDLAAPVQLGPGRYSVVATGFGSLDRNINLGYMDSAPKVGSIMNNGGGLLSFVGRGRYGSYTNGAFQADDVVPGNTAYPANVFGAGTFRYSAAVPDGGATSMLLAMGLAGIVGIRRVLRK
jgi:VPDSG-CTERM motif